MLAVHVEHCLSTWPEKESQKLCTSSVTSIDLPLVAGPFYCPFCCFLLIGAPELRPSTGCGSAAAHEGRGGDTAPGPWADPHAAAPATSGDRRCWGWPSPPRAGLQWVSSRVISGSERERMMNGCPAVRKELSFC